MSDELRQYGDLALHRRVLQQARPYWPHLGALVLLSLLATPLALLLPVPLLLTVDCVLGSAQLPGFLKALLPGDWQSDKATLLAVVAVGLVGVTLMVRLQGLLDWMLGTWIGEQLVLRFRARLFGHLQRLSLAFHDQRGTTDSIYRVQYDAASIQHLVVQGLIPLCSAAVKLITMIAVIAAIDRTLALVALAVCPALFTLTQWFRSRLRRQWRAVKEVESRAMSVVQESLAAVRVVKAFGQEEREQERYMSHASASLAAHLRAIFAEGIFGLLVGLITAGGTAAVLYLGARAVLAGTLSLGELLLVMGYLAQLYEPLREIGTKVGDVQKSLASAERAFRLLDETPEVAQARDARPLQRARGEVDFVSVGFGYGPGREVLRGVSFNVPPGTRVGIAGRTGAGKTTLVSLLPRFYDPVRGTVKLDGVDVRRFKLADLRNQFSLVLQEPMLFRTSIAENIAYGRPGASQAEIEAAARAAAVHEFAASLPDGYATEVGERGALLSGGERQRISLARAFLKNAPVLILDEPTSAVDVATEASILDAMERLMQGRTTFVIAHRLGTLARCDLRLVVEGGTVRKVTGDLSKVILDGPDKDPK